MIFYSRLIISKKLLAEEFKQLDGGANQAYIKDGLPNIVFMQYQEDGKEYFTTLDKEDYSKIKDVEWEGFNEYVVMKKNHRKYLHRELCRGLEDGQEVHHKNHRFDNRSSELVPVYRIDHTRQRTYYGDVVF